MPDQLKGATAENLLTLLCWNERHCQALALKLLPEHFNLRAYQEIATPALEFIQQYGKPPQGHIMDLLENKVRRGDDHSKLLRLTLEQMEQLQSELNADYVLSQLDHFIRKSTIKRLAEQADALADADDLDKAEQTLAQGAFSNKNKFESGIWVHKPEQVLAFMDAKEETDFFSSGVEALDTRGIRPYRKAVYLFMAPAKAGKSWHLVQIGVEAMLAGKNVLHITLENSQERTGLRYVQNICAASSREVNKLHVTQFEKDEYNNLASKLTWEILNRQISISPEHRTKLESKLRATSVRGKILIKEFPTGMLSIAELNAYMDYLEKSEGFIADILVLDYVDLMTVDARNLRIDVGRVMRDFRGLCVKRGIAGVTATQTNRASISANVIGGGHVAEDWSKIGTADVIVSYNQTGRERERNIARLFVVGARDMKDKFLVLVTQAYELGIFCLDSVFFSNAVADKVEEYLNEQPHGDD